MDTDYKVCYERLIFDLRLRNTLASSSKQTTTAFLAELRNEFSIVLTQFGLLPTMLPETPTTSTFTVLLYTNDYPLPASAAQYTSHLPSLAAANLQVDNSASARLWAPLDIIPTDEATSAPAPTIVPIRSIRVKDVEMEIYIEENPRRHEMTSNPS
jgi:hypothetical protein